MRRTPGDETPVTNGFTYYSSTDATVRVLYSDPRVGASVGGSVSEIAATGAGPGADLDVIGANPGNLGEDVLAAGGDLGGGADLGADPGAVKLRDGSWLLVVTGPPRPGTASAAQRMRGGPPGFVPRQ